jgi:SAM-dependent methyltransferase
MTTLPPDVVAVLRCPYCIAKLAAEPTRFVCSQCASEFPIVDRQPDFRLRKPVQRTLTFAIGSDRPAPEAFAFTYPMPHAGDAWIEREQFDKLHRPHVSLLTYVPRPSGPSLALDLGCGSAHDRAFLEALGYTYVGCDPFDRRAPMLADGHALPFAPGSFRAVFALTVMEHFQNPFVATSEVRRVLAKDGRFIGTVEQLVPFHMNSYYNMTKFGIFNTLVQSGMNPICISPSTGWTALGAHYGGSYWRGVPAWIRTPIAKSQDAISKLSWKLRAVAKREPTAGLELEWWTKFAGGFKFVAEPS